MISSFLFFWIHQKKIVGLCDHHAVYLTDFHEIQFEHYIIPSHTNLIRLFPIKMNSNIVDAQISRVGATLAPINIGF
jgi:hypothetical protein